MMFSWGHFYLTINEKAIRAARRGQVQRRDLPAAGRRHSASTITQFKMGDMELAEHYVKWDAPQMAGVDMEYFRKHGYFHLAVGTPDDRLPHANGNFPTPVRQSRVPGQGRQELRRAAVPHDVRARCNRARTSIRCRAMSPPRESPASNPAPRQALSAQRHLAEEPRLPQFMLRQRAAQDQRSGRAIRDDQPQGCGRAQHPRGRSGAGLQRPRRLRGLCASHRRCAAMA